ncbi:MAG: hypothetical protein NTZ54_10475 [Alphaproteobacteria bacterium]|nr:hypothetical protein [Alphaproteobacteria bacterium]
MSKTLTLLLASAAMTAAIGLPAWSALHAPGQGETIAPLAALTATANDARPLILAENDDHEDEGGSVTRRESNDDEGACEDDDGNCGTAAAAAPAPAGSVPPPQNGLFDNGTAPKVQVK